MPYYNYHTTVHTLIEQGKLTGWHITEKHNAISPALVLLFDDFKHPVMPIREHRWNEYMGLLPVDMERE